MEQWRGRLPGRYLGGWILNDAGEPVPEPDSAAAWRWRDEHPERWKLAVDERPGVRVSTVLLPIDHGFGTSPPILFETMVFAPGRPYDQYTLRYATRAEALQGHASVVGQLLCGTLAPSDSGDEDD